MKNKKIYLIIGIILFVLMLIPIPIKLKDGGTVKYKAILYSITKYHSLSIESYSGYEDGLEIKILGITVYDK